MKKLLIISCSLLLLVSCKKDKVPDTVNINSVTVTNFPNLDGTSSWDLLSDADLFIKIAVAGTVVWSAPTPYTDAWNTTDYLFTPSAPVSVTTLTDEVQIDFYDYEDIGSDTWMGGVLIDFDQYKVDGPTSKSLTSTNFDITLSLSWSVTQ